MKTIFPLLFLMLALNVLAQDYNFHLNTVDLDSIDHNIYEDSFGDCFEKSLLLESYDHIFEERQSYSIKGLVTNERDVANLKIEFVENYTGWVKKKADKNCQSNDPNDCLVWCQSKIQRRALSVKVINEDLAVSLEAIDDDTIELLSNANYLIFSQIECELKPEVVLAVNEALTEYFEEPIETDEMIFQLNIYQYQNDLPIVGYNLETLLDLGI